ncbi:hypothetical protein PHOSAC3_140213 [Mesotoga infera]|nr:hypothetical protein PHOSAC3_140213 [Mesotoga infera]
MLLRRRQQDVRTYNVVFISVQRVFALKRTAVLMIATWNIQLATVLSKYRFMVLDG